MTEPVNNHQWLNSLLMDLAIELGFKMTETQMLKLTDTSLAILSKLESIEQEAYKKGYNENARDCYCDSPGATEGVIPHHHLLDYGKSHNIRPDIKGKG